MHAHALEDYAHSATVRETSSPTQAFVCPCGVEFRVWTRLGEIKRIEVDAAEVHACADAVGEIARDLAEELRCQPSEANWRAKWALEPRSMLATATRATAPDDANRHIAGTPPSEARSEGGADQVSRPPQNTGTRLKTLGKRKLPSTEDRTLASQRPAWEDLPPCVMYGPARPVGTVGQDTFAKVVHAGVDWLEISIHVVPPDELLAALADEKDAAKEGEKVIRKLHDTFWRVSRGSGGPRHQFLLENEHAVIAIANKSKKTGKVVASVPSLRIKFNLGFLTEVGPRAAWLWGRALAMSMHTEATKPKENLSRLDMCVDTVGADFSTMDHEDLVMRARKLAKFRGKAMPQDDWVVIADQLVKNCATIFTNVEDDAPRLARALERFDEQRRTPDGLGEWAKTTARLALLGNKKTTDEERAVDRAGMARELARLLEARYAEPNDVVPLAEHRSSRKLTGFQAGRGDLVVRAYNKSQEIREISRGKTWLYGIWAKSGWVSSDTVWRIEAQLRREGIKSLCSRETGQHLDLSSPEGLMEALPSLWNYVVGGRKGSTAWIKWTVPGKDSNRARRDVRPEWKVIQHADWGHERVEELLRFKIAAASYRASLSALLGAVTKAAAVRGPMLDGRVPMLLELEGDLRRLADAKGTNVETLVNEKRVNLALWGLEVLVEKEKTGRRALAIAAGDPSETANSMNVVKRAWRRAVKEEAVA